VALHRQQYYEVLRYDWEIRLEATDLHVERRRICDGLIWRSVDMHDVEFLMRGMRGDVAFHVTFPSPPARSWSGNYPHVRQAFPDAADFWLNVS
jgi:hypothetical protein